MDLIMIRTDSSERGNSIASCLRTLFPLCEIVVRPGNLEGYEDVRKAPVRDTHDIRAERSKGCPASIRK